MLAELQSERVEAPKARFARPSEREVELEHVQSSKQERASCDSSLMPLRSQPAVLSQLLASQRSAARRARLATSPMIPDGEGLLLTQMASYLDGTDSMVIYLLFGGIVLCFCGLLVCFVRLTWDELLKSPEPPEALEV